MRWVSGAWFGLSPSIFQQEGQSPGTRTCMGSHSGRGGGRENLHIAELLSEGLTGLVHNFGTAYMGNSEPDLPGVGRQLTSKDSQDSGERPLPAK